MKQEEGGSIKVVMEKANDAERRQIRMERAAEKLLEGVLRRRQWAVSDRDKIAEFLSDLVSKELNAVNPEVRN